MNAPFFPVPRPAARALPGAGRASFGQAAGSAASMKWAALQDAGNAVSALAGLPPERIAPEVRNFPALLRDVDPRRRELAEHSIDDLAAVMEPGLSALLAVKARGADATAPALALWHEFSLARAALLELVPPSGVLGPRRSA
jgi:hypothetical protein